MFEADITHEDKIKCLCRKLEVIEQHVKSREYIRQKKHEIKHGSLKKHTFGVGDLVCEKVKNTL